MGWAAVAGGMLFGLFWLKFAITDAAGDAPEAVALFESAFPVADALLACTLIAAGVALLRASPAGPFLLAAAGGALLFLAVLDVTYFLRQGLYLPLTTESGLELLVNALSIAGGAGALRYAWPEFRGAAKAAP